ncbi:D-2-hydroxyacid dehydrogenase family protein [Arthrobacter sp. BE255]|uniref:D-2-hydroxyacid dehydrogenase family protein n=1 Tax=Arthrobacter sp. BE255 TaxID=2817721 RepID=UPI0028591836|nr:D-2-hydroxyacid dehydrogenase family protein [Arthrobacter sp. BE255]MDR7159059.1 phosphoglycerate dehydrogenase-like enzyme [Arthrobacter sp. BE255]
MALRCAVLDDYQDAARTYADWSPIEDRVEVTVFREHFTDESVLAERLAPFEIVVIMRERTPFPATLLERLPRLKLLVTTGMRNSAVDLEAARKRDVTVCGTKSNSEPPAELTWALILGLTRNLRTEADALSDGGPWQQTVGTDLHGATLGLVGLGKIGSQIARVGNAFGMNVLACSEHLTEEQAEAAGATKAPSLQAVLAASDIVSLHLVLGDRTRNLIGAGELALMKPGAILINTSRAGLVDQQALIDALTARRIAGAGLDVYAQEPLPAGHAFRTLPNVLATPHLGYVTGRNYSTYFSQAIENIDAFLNGAALRTL